MADILAVGDILEVRTVCRLSNQFGINVRHLKATTVPGAATDFNIVALALAATLAPLFKAALASQAEFYGLGVRRLSPNPSLETTTYQGAGPGSVIGDPMSSQTAGVISLKTGLPGRAFRGRMYIPYPAKVDSDSTGRPLLAYRNALSGIANKYVASSTWTNGGTTFTTVGVLWHKRTKTATNLSSDRVREDWGTQRRRSQINRPDRAPF